MSGLDARYRLGARALRLGSLLAGVPLPAATLAPLDAPLPVARWLADELQNGRTPHVWTFASSAVLVCQAANDAGLDIRGARFTGGGEPTTAARRAVVESVGAVLLPRMGATESDILAYACAHPEAPDDMHFFDDRHALIQPGSGFNGSDRSGPGFNESGAGPGGGPALPAKAMLLSSLLPSAPILLLNVCMGDQAEITRRSCGCGLERDGWGVHIHAVRSFEKLTAGGITLLDIDVIRVLEEVLPARFGGSPTDYQLLETLDGARARPEIRLLVNPALGDIDPTAISDAFFNAIGGGTGGERLMELQWRSGGLVRIVRERPRKTASGKILHLFLDHS
jgi:hypothetical protein